MSDINKTRFFNFGSSAELSVEETLECACRAMEEKGYNPINQIVGFIMSGDPTYITSHMNARNIMTKLERDDIVEELLKFYVEKHGWS